MEIINETFKIDIYGFSGRAVNKDYVRTAFGLMDKMWQAVKTNNLKNKGLNVFVYEEDEQVFAGVELNDIPEQSIGLERKSITLTRYAYYKHIGSYNLIKQAGEKMRDELKNKGLDVTFPYVEIYGHWTSEESKLETELLMSLK
jgi:effector-binding domain-containing protein